MNLYKITRTDIVDWDENRGFVICCDDEEECRCLAKTCRGYEPVGVWDTAVIELLGKNALVEKGIVLQDFKVG